MCESRGVWNIFARHRCRPGGPFPSPLNSSWKDMIMRFWRQTSTYRRQNSNIWCQKVALYSNITDKIQTEWICVPLKTSCFVRKKLPTKLIRNPTPPAISVSKKLELTPLGKHRNSIETWQGVGGKPKIVAKRDLSVYNSAWRAFFRWTLNFILLPEDWVCWLSPNIWRDTVSKWTHRLLKEVAIWKEACIVHVGAFIHDYQGDEASWSRKCLSWKDCPSAWAQLSTDNVNFCTRSRPYQREASRPSGPGRDFFRFF